MVVAILSLFIAMATPRFRLTYLDLQLSSQARDLAKFLTYAQQRSVVEGKVYRFESDTENRSYWLMVEKEDGEEAFEPISGRYGRHIQLPAGISLESDPPSILFFPDGSSDSFTLTLENLEGKVLLLTKGKSFDHVRIEEKSS